MSIKRRQQASGSIGLIITFLALVALIGLLTGVLAHTLLSRSGAAAQVAAPTSAATHQPTSAPSSSTATSATATGTPAPPTSHFQLSVTVTPRTVAPGQQLTVVVNAFDPNTHAPIAGLPCTLRAPTDHSPSLFTSWPASQTTNTDGAVRWTLTAPSETPGTYEVEAYAQTSQWSFTSRTAVVLKAS